jgi:copper chaperone CopZ
MYSESFTVTGMSCGHCVASVTEEVKTLPGVSEVTIVLASGQVSVTVEEPIDPSDLSRVISGAGFQLATPVGS